MGFNGIQWDLTKQNRDLNKRQVGIQQDLIGFNHPKPWFKQDKLGFNGI